MNSLILACALFASPCSNGSCGIASRPVARAVTAPVLVLARVNAARPKPIRAIIAKIRSR